MARAVSALVADSCTSRDVVLCPPFTSLQAVNQVLANSPIALGAQNLHWESEGAFTGEVSAAMILTSGCRYVILGHSERRQFFGETDEVVRRKLAAALKAGLEPIVCVGETLQQREAGHTNSVVLGQLESALDGIPSDDISRVSLAYEPVWAIGTGRNASPDQAQDAIGWIRDTVAITHGSDVADRVRIQYGGSVTSDNCVDLLRRDGIDGALVGGASLDATHFATIVLAAT